MPYRDFNIKKKEKYTFALESNFWTLKMWHFLYAISSEILKFFAYFLKVRKIFAMPLGGLVRHLLRRAKSCLKNLIILILSLIAM